MIDDDLGVSAAVPDSREGFARLVTEVTMGRAGVVLGIEMSRLARTGKDWHHLLELCSLSGTLLADPDAVYDPGYYNDRLLLGLKGTMSEALSEIRHNASSDSPFSRSKICGRHYRTRTSGPDPALPRRLWWQGADLRSSG